jgi:phenylalanyl-tRNA synthetase alpha chain
MELTLNEKRLLNVFKDTDIKNFDINEIAEKLSATPEAAMQWGLLLESKGLIKVTKIVKKYLVFTNEGKDYAINGLPETRLRKVIKPNTPISELKKHPDFNIGFGHLRRKNLIKVENGLVSLLCDDNYIDLDDTYLQEFLAHQSIQSVLNRDGVV